MVAPQYVKNASWEMMRCCCTLVLGGLDGRGRIVSITFLVGCRVRCERLGWLGGCVAGFGRVPGVLLRVWRWWVRCLMRCTRGILERSELSSVVSI